LAERIATYSLIFDQPAVEKPDPAQWEPDTLPLVFAVSTRRLVPGMDHLGIRTDSGLELATTLDCLLQPAPRGIAGRPVLLRPRGQGVGGRPERHPPGAVLGRGEHRDVRRGPSAGDGDHRP